MEQDILRVEQVSVSFDGFTVLDGMTFNVGYGELRFLIGPNGAGKTTLLDIIVGKTRPDHGRVLFDGHDTHGTAEFMLVRHGIGRKFQTPTIFPSLSVAHNIEVALGFRQRITRLLRKMPAEAQARLMHTLETVGLADKAEHIAGTLSHGEKQWLEIAMLLVQEPKLLLLDEPVAGMTRRERDKTGALLQNIGQQLAVLVVEHDMEFVRQFAQKVTVLHGGKVLCEGTIDEVQRDERVIEVYLGRGQIHGPVAA